MGLFDSLKQEAIKKAQELAQKASESLGNTQTEHDEEEQVPPMPPMGGEMPATSLNPEPAITNNDQTDEGLYDPRMEKLIHAALADGVLTEKEKQVLFKKAETMGIDLDEFEMILDARLYEKQHSKPQAQQQKAAPTSNKYGDVKKCPSCGAIVQSFTTQCPECGFEFRGIGAVSSFAMLSAKLEQIDKQNYGDFANKFRDIDDIDEAIIKKKKSTIRNFPVPTTKADILEFLSMATPLAKLATKKATKQLKWYSDYDPDEMDISIAWRDKCEQVIIKARFSMKEDKQTLEDIENYATQLGLD